MTTLAQLQAGKLIGEKHLTLQCGLKEFPLEILDMAESLEILDMTNNNLTTLPDEFETLKKLKILFLSNNQFRILPKVLKNCKNLTMIGFRNNRIDTFPEDILPLKLQWLILTDNHITTLPNSIGKLLHLQKLMLSGNKIRILPKTLLKCSSLELLRLASNQMSYLPFWLLTLPKLSWFAYAGNSFCFKHPSTEEPLTSALWNQLEIKEKLGEGASGEIFRANYHHEEASQEVAVKIFKGEITSDGLPQEEMDINISLGHHDHLIDVLAKVTDHPEGKALLILELIPSNYRNLGLPPTLESCTRDVYSQTFQLTLSKAIKILKAMASAGAHLHAHGIMHGDFYAHNIMIDEERNSLLVDFGAASYFNPHEPEVCEALERLEVRAFGCLIEEMLILSREDKKNEEKREQLEKLKELTVSENTFVRPLFKTILENLETM